MKNVKQADNFLNRNAVTYLKAVAIVLMVIHHFWGYPTWVLEKNTMAQFLIGGGYNPEYIIGKFGIICVDIFAFLTGYLFYINYDKYLSIKYRLKKGFIFLCNYWIIYLFVIILGKIIGEPLPDLYEIGANLFGWLTGPVLKRTFINVSFAWYVSFYIEILLLFPILFRKNSNRYWELMKWILLTFISLCIIHFAAGTEVAIEMYRFYYYMPEVCIGYFVSKYKVFGRMSLIVDKIFPDYMKMAFSIITIVIIVLFRYICGSIGYFDMDWIYIIPFIFSLVVLGRGLKKRLSILWRIISFLEKNSTNIWFLHGIFFTPNRTLQFIAYWPHYGVLIVIWVLIITGGISVLLSPIQKSVRMFIERA